MKYQLFLDTTNKDLFIGLTRNKLILMDFQINNEKKHTENSIENIGRILKQFQLTFNDIGEIYLTNGPGSFTGIRVAITLTKIIKLLHPNIKVFVLSSLHLQAGMEPRVISLIDGRSNGHYFAIYSYGVLESNIRFLTNEQVMKIEKRKPNYKVFKDMKSILIMSNFMSLKSKAVFVEDMQLLEPLYIKDLGLKVLKYDHAQ